MSRGIGRNKCPVNGDGLPLSRRMACPWRMVFQYIGIELINDGIEALLKVIKGTPPRL